MSELCVHREPTGRVIIVIVTERGEKERERHEERRERRSRVYVENVLVCTFKTPVSFMTRERFERTHGSVFGARQEETHTSPRHTTHSSAHHNIKTQDAHHTLNTRHDTRRTTRRTTRHIHTTHSHTPHTRMLGHVHGEQPTVILRRKSECLDICTDTPPTTILHSIKICNICNVCNFMRTLFYLELTSSGKIFLYFFTYRNGFGNN